MKKQVQFPLFLLLFILMIRPFLMISIHGYDDIDDMTAENEILVGLAPF